MTIRWEFLVWVCLFAEGLWETVDLSESREDEAPEEAVYLTYGVWY